MWYGFTTNYVTGLEVVLPGGVLGKMISPQNLAICAPAVGIAGQEGRIFRRSSAGASRSSS